MTTEVRHETDRSRYELSVEGKVIGFADYHVVGDRVVFPHTVIDPAMRGRGYGAVLVQGALDDVRRSGRTVVPQCWYVAQFIEEHAEYGDLLAV